VSITVFVDDRNPEPAPDEEEPAASG